MSWKANIVRAWKEPGLALYVLRGMLAGGYYRLKYRLLRQHVVIGKGFKVYGGLRIRGRGTVTVGNDCTVVSSRASPTTISTYAHDSVIRIGNNVMITGARIGCRTLIEIGDRAGISDCRMRDTDHHDVIVKGNEMRANTLGVAKPIIIGPNVWVCAGTMILKGVSIGANSVVGAGAVVMTDVLPNRVVVGNPARVVRHWE